MRTLAWGELSARLIQPYVEPCAAEVPGKGVYQVRCRDVECCCAEAKTRGLLSASVRWVTLEMGIRHSSR